MAPRDLNLRLDKDASNVSATTRPAARPRHGRPSGARATRHRGRLIVVEGIDGSGKSTQIQLLRKWLESRGHKVVFTEWNSSDLVRQATKRGKKKNLLTPTTFSLLHATDFADRLTYDIIPYLKAGITVLADRYIYTAFARDIAGGVDPRWVRQLYAFAVKPDAAFYFRVPLDVAVRRILGARAKIKFYEAGMDLNLSSNPVESFRLFQGRVLEQYDALTGEYGFRVIDGTRSIDTQQRQVRDIVRRLYDEEGAVA
jgi:dTMP kinase